MNSVINWGIVSTGQMASDMAAAFEFTRGSRALAVCSRSREKAEAFGARFGIERRYAEYREFLEDGDVDAVYIASPHNAHFPQVMAALEAGRNVVCEKPLALNAAQAEKCAAAAREKGLFLMEAVWMRFFPLIERLRETLAEGTIGIPRYVSADFFLDIRDPEHRLLNPVMAGGALLDLGLYPLNFTRMVLGPLESITGHSRLSDRGVDLVDSMSVRSAAGDFASLGCGLVGDKPREAFVVGSEGCVKLHEIFFRPEEMTLGRGRDAAESIRMPFIGNGYPHEILHVEECLRSGAAESPLMTLDESIDVLSMMDDFRKAQGIRYSDGDESSEYPG